MPGFDDVTAITDELAGVERGQHFNTLAWKVNGKAFAWERPFSKADIKRYGSEPVPGGPILGVVVDDLDDKQAILAEEHQGVFTIPHFDNYAALLIQLDAVEPATLRDLVVDAWLCKAPVAAAKAYLAAHPPG